MKSWQIKRLLALTLFTAVLFGNGCDPQKASQILSIVNQGLAMANQMGVMAQMRRPGAGSIVDSRVPWSGVGVRPQVVNDSKFHAIDDKGQVTKNRVLGFADGRTTLISKADKVTNIPVVKNLVDKSVKEARAEERIKTTRDNLARADFGDVKDYFCSAAGNAYEKAKDDTSKVASSFLSGVTSSVTSGIKSLFTW